MAKIGNNYLSAYRVTKMNVSTFGDEPELLDRLAYPAHVARSKMIPP